MKPVFEQEISFIQEMTGIKLPLYCWRDGTKIYLNSNSDKPLIKFKVENEQIIITSNIIKKINKNTVEVEYLKNKKTISEEWINKTWDEEIEENKERLDFLFNQSVGKTIEFINEHPGFELRESVSGGKDSDILFEVMKEVYKQLNRDDYVIDYFNPSNETAQTYLHIKNDYNKEKLQIHNPDKGWYQWLKEDKNYFLPSAMVRNCCSQFKELKVKKLLDKKKNYIIFLGMRKFESAKRQNYDWDLNKAMGDKNNMPENWLRFLPIVEWTDQDVWFYIMKNKIKINPMYYLGFNRVGCIICPFQSDYIDLLVKKYYKHLWNRYELLLEGNYRIYNIGSRLKWSLEEWKQGKWKQGTSKEQDIIQKSPTKARIQELADLKGISIELAEKYFKKTCSCCDKKLNPEEVAMNLKWYGRNMNLEKMECRKCFCISNNMSKEDYQLKTREYMNNGCNLF